MINWGRITGSLNDVVDILLVAYVLYKLILFLRGTRAIQLLKGFLIIVGVWVLSTYFELRTLQWLMSQAFTYGVLAILIIFQPELRRALEQLGRGWLFTRTLQTPQEAARRMVTEVIKAVTYMAKRRIGALIVISRSTGLEEVVETGTPIGGRVSAELLINLFTPNTPLHDGAVVIQGETILAAGCYLPLSDNPYIGKELGTRHRAALGISETADVLSVVVSEETGRISLAMDGEMWRDLSEETLRAIMEQHLVPPPRPERHGYRLWPWKERRHG